MQANQTQPDINLICCQLMYEYWFGYWETKTKKWAFTHFRKTPFLPIPRLSFTPNYSTYNQRRLHSVPPVRQWAVQGRDCSQNIAVSLCCSFPLTSFLCSSSGPPQIAVPSGTPAPAWSTSYSCDLGTASVSDFTLHFLPFLKYVLTEAPPTWSTQLWLAAGLVVDAAGIHP